MQSIIFNFNPAIMNTSLIVEVICMSICSKRENGWFNLLWLHVYLCKPGKRLADRASQSSELV